MSELTIVTNNVPRDILDAFELSETERAEFDYLDWAAIDEGRDSRSFVRYKGELIDLSDLDGPTSYGQSQVSGELTPLYAWHAYRSDSFFSGLVFRWPDEDCETVIVGRYYS